jgi:CRISPR-associated exonuclease Cas4
LHDLVEAGVTPPAVYGPKCDNCSLLHLCLPKPRRDEGAVKRYLDRMIAADN